MPASRKRQVRLAFSPLPSSSPAAKTYNKQIQDRAAAVVLDGRSPPMRHRRESTNLATIDDQDSDDLPLRPTQRTSTLSKRHSRSRQQRIDFSMVRDTDSFDEPIQIPSSSVQTRSSRPGIFSSQAQGRIMDSESDASGFEQLPSPRKVLSNRRKASRTVTEDDEDSDSIEVGTKHHMNKHVQGSDDEEDEMPTTMGKQTRRRTARQTRDSFIDDEEPATISSDEDDLIPASSAKNRRRRRRARKSESDDDGQRRKRRRAAGSEEEGEEEEESDVPKTPNRRKRQRRQLTQQEEDDLAEDVRDLGAGSDSEEADQLPPRSTQSVKKTAHQIALQKLRQKRGAQPTQEETRREPASSAQGDVILLSEDEEESADGNFDQLLDEEDEERERGTPQYTRSRDIFKADAYDEGFLDDEENEDGLLGVPANLPIEFTHYATMKPKELFRYAIDWMVQRKINPAFDRNDPLYNLTFRKLDDELQGLAGSKFTSSAWTPEFTFALQARPELAYSALDRSHSGEHWMRDKCDACNRSGHPATYELQFQGKPYHRDTLEEVVNEDEEDDDSSGSEDQDDEGKDNAGRNQPAYDAQGREVPPESKSFYVGKFCRANAETAHELYHWRKHLSEHVEGYLKGRGLMEPEKLAKREKMSTSKRRKKANKIVDEMEASGEFKRLWQVFRDKIDQARNSKQGRFSLASP